MKNTKKKILRGSLIAGAIIGASSLTASPADLFTYNDLGSGSEVRAALVEEAMNSSSNLFLELKCGEGKCGEEKKEETKSKTKKGETKAETKEGETKAETKETKKKKEGKSEEGKCGEGKCGL